MCKTGKKIMMNLFGSNEDLNFYFYFLWSYSSWNKRK